MSTAELYMEPEEITDFIAETRKLPQYFYGYEGQEYGVCPFITFYIYRPNHGYRNRGTPDQESYNEDFLPLCHEVIELHQELQALIDKPYQSVYNSNTQNWVKATLGKLGREMLQKHAQLRIKDGRSLWIRASDQESPAASALWAIGADITDNPWMCYTTVKITFRDSWYREHKNIWHAFVNKWIQRLQPEQCYSGYEIGTTTTGVLGAYESDVMERICADYFYGLDVDHPLKMGYHYHGNEKGYINYSDIGSGLRTPTWSFLLSPLWRSKLGKSVEEVKAALRHPEIQITEFPYPVSKHNPKGEPALWIQLGELSLYPVDEGVPELLILANDLIRPVRADLLQLYTLDQWEDDPNPRFDEENSPRWMARFDKDSDWPSKEKRFLKPPLEKPKKSEIPPSVPGGKPCPKAGRWATLAQPGSARNFEEGEIMPDFPGSSYGATFWQWVGPSDDKKR
jgi:hypothetical protein